MAKYCSKKLYLKVVFDKVGSFIEIIYNFTSIWSYAKI